MPFNSASDAFQLHPDVRSYGTTLSPRRGGGGRRFDDAEVAAATRDAESQWERERANQRRREMRERELGRRRDWNADDKRPDQVVMEMAAVLQASLAPDPNDYSDHWDQGGVGSGHDAMEEDALRAARAPSAPPLYGGPPVTPVSTAPRMTADELEMMAFLAESEDPMDPDTPPAHVVAARRKEAEAAKDRARRARLREQMDKKDDAAVKIQSAWAQKMESRGQGGGQSQGQGQGQPQSAWQRRKAQDEAQRLERRSSGGTHGARQRHGARYLDEVE